jgi:hypothetical protein
MNGVCSQVYLMIVLSLLWLYYRYPFVASQEMPIGRFTVVQLWSNLTTNFSLNFVPIPLKLDRKWGNLRYFLLFRLR